MNVPAHVLADTLVLLEHFEQEPEAMAYLSANHPLLFEACQRLRKLFNEAKASTIPPPPDPPARPDWRKDWPADWPACVTASCLEPASFGFSWPSQPRLSACFTCILKVLEVGDVLGLDAKALELVYLPAVKP